MLQFTKSKVLQVYAVLTMQCFTMLAGWNPMATEIDTEGLPELKFEPIAIEETITQEVIPEEKSSEAITAQEIMNTLVRETPVKSQSIQKDELNITYEDAQCLMRIGTAEAEIDGVEGIAAVMSTVLNRVKDSRFPNTIKEVVFQNRQFSPIDDGRYYSVDIPPEAHMALAEIEKGTYNWMEALYFENAEDSWQSKNLEYLYTIGHHRFYK